MKPHLPISIRIGLPCLFLALAFHTTAQQPDAQYSRPANVIIGALEDQPGHYTGDSNFRTIRALFRKQGLEWRPFPMQCPNVECLKLIPKSYPAQMTWTIAFDGRNLGHVEARTPPQYDFYSEIGTEKIISNAPVPTVGKRSEKYAGWPGGSVYRPLVAVSHPNFKDPDNWKPARLSPEQLAAVRAEFRKKFPKASNCRNPYENKLSPWKYMDEDIKLRSAYSSINGWSLVQVGLGPEKWACDGPQGENSPFIDQWYVLKPSGQLRYLGEGMFLVDAGDYDSDGKSEVLFAAGGYNWDGYRLFYADFSRSAEFHFSYH